LLAFKDSSREHVFHNEQMTDCSAFSTVAVCVTASYQNCNRNFVDIG